MWIALNPIQSRLTLLFPRYDFAMQAKLEEILGSGMYLKIITKFLRVCLVFT